MSVLPEIIIQKVIVNGIREFRERPDKLSQIFRNAPQNFVQSFYDLLVKTPIDITLSYPREDSQFPCVAIILRGEQETDFFIGDILGAGYDNESGLNTIDGFFFTPDEDSPVVPTPELSKETVGEPRRMFDLDNPTYKEQRGSGFRTSYLLQIMTDNQDFTVFLYAAIKNILVSNLMVFEKNGLLDISISGSDFMPQAIQQPNFVFLRGITMSFLNYFDYIVDMNDAAEHGELGASPIAKGVVLDIEPASELGAVITDESLMVPEGEKVYSILASTQSPHLREVGLLASPSRINPLPLPWKPVPDGRGDVDPLIAPFTGSAGSTLTGVMVRGINLKTGAVIEISPTILPEKIMGYAPINKTKINITEVDIISEIENIKFQSSFSGQSNSTSLVFRASVSESVPLDLSEGMFLQVTGPKTHGAYRETRRVVSASDTSKTITVSEQFSASLANAFVRVIERQNSLQFAFTVPLDAMAGKYDVKVTNTDLLSSTLSAGFEIV
jgi:hypothetical protein